MSERTDLPSPSAGNFPQRVRETLMTYLGRQGNPLDRGLTLRDLIENGIIKLSKGWRPGGGVPLLEPGDAVTQGDEPDLTPPPTPTGFTVSAAISHVFIEHDATTYLTGHGHLRTRVYGVTHISGQALPTFSAAVELGQFSGTAWAMPSNPATTWRLWIKWESADGVLSALPAGGANGLEAITGQDVATLLAALTGEITESQLYQDLGARIDLIDGSGPGSVNARVQTETTARASETGQLFARYTVKVDVNDYVAGFGLASTANGATPTSSFAFRADAFYIANPSGPGVAPAMPFIVRTTPVTINGVEVPVGVYMSDAFIQNGTITNAKIANLAVDNAKVANLDAAKINAGYLSADRIQAGSIDTKLLNVDAATITYGYINVARIADATITSAKIGNVIQSNNFQAGSTGWQINKDGTAEFHNVIARGDVLASSVTAGSSPSINGTTMTGSGVSVSTAGLFCIGNASGNVTFNGTQMTLNGQVVATNNITEESVNIFKLARGASLPDYVRTFKGASTPTVTINSWMALQLDGSALNNKIGANDYDAYRTLLPAGTYFYELSVPVKCDGSDTNDACYTAIISNPPGTPSGTYQTVCGNVWVGSGKDGYWSYQCWQEFVPSTYAVLSTAGVNVVGDWQTATIFGVGRFTLVTPGYISAAVMTTDASPSMYVVARSGYSTTILRIWRDAN